MLIVVRSFSCHYYHDNVLSPTALTLSTIVINQNSKSSPRDEHFTMYSMNQRDDRYHLEGHILLGIKLFCHHVECYYRFPAHTRACTYK